MSFNPVNLWHDLRRRNVFKVAAIYVASAWLVIQVADVLIDRIPAFSDPDRAMTLLIAAVIAGFPIASILAWLFEIGPDGIVRTQPGSATGVGAIIVSLGLLAAGTAGLFVLLGRESTLAPPVAEYIVPDSIAVLPFADLSPGDGTLNLGAGIAEVLRAHLGETRRLRVISGRSTVEAIEAGLGIAGIRAELKVPQLLEGSIQRSGGRLRVTAQLVDTHSKEALWSDVFEGPAAEIFRIQDDIVQRVADAVTAETDPVATSAEYDLDAYDLYLLANDSLASAVYDEGFAEAIDIYRRALEKDPSMAPAWAGLAIATYWHGQQGFIDAGEAVDKSWEYSNHALEVDARTSDAHAIQIVLYATTQENDRAEEAYRKAIEYNPSSTLAYVYYGGALRQQGRWQEALDVLQLGIELFPYKPHPYYQTMIAGTRMNLGEYEEPMRMLGEIYLDHIGKPTEAQYLRSMARAALDRHHFDDAAALYAMERATGKGIARSRANAAEASLRMRRIEDAEMLITEADELLAAEAPLRAGLDKDQAYVEFTQVMIYLATDDTRNVLAWINDLNAMIEGDPDDEYSRWRLWDLVFVNLALGRLEDAVRTSALLARDETDIENYSMAAYAHRELARREVSRGNMHRGEELQNQAADYLERARLELDRTRSLTSLSSEFFVYLAAYHAVASEDELALDMLEQAYAAHYRNLSYIQLMPMFESIRDESRYLEVVRKIREDLDAMSARVDQAAATGDWESIVANYLGAGKPTSLAH